MSNWWIANDMLYADHQREVKTGMIKSSYAHGTVSWPLPERYRCGHEGIIYVRRQDYEHHFDGLYRDEPCEDCREEVKADELRGMVEGASGGMLSVQR